MDILAAAFEIMGMWLFGNRNRTACYAFFACELLWIEVAIHEGLPGLLVVVLIGMVMNVRIWYKWKN